MWIRMLTQFLSPVRVEMRLKKQLLKPLDVVRWLSKSFAIVQHFRQAAAIAVSSRLSPFLAGEVRIEHVTAKAKAAWRFPVDVNTIEKMLPQASCAVSQETEYRVPQILSFILKANGVNPATTTKCMSSLLHHLSRTVSDSHRPDRTNEPARELSLRM